MDDRELDKAITDGLSELHEMIDMVTGLMVLARWRLRPPNDARELVVEADPLRHFWFGNTGV